MAITLSRIGQANGSGDADANFETIYLSEVMTAFYRRNIFKPLHRVRVISHGTGASFPTTWKTSAQYFTAGGTLTGNNAVKHARKTINIDERLISDIFVDQLDEVKNDYGVRSIYTEAQGHALAEAYDANVARVLIKAARTAAANTRNAEAEQAGATVGLDNMDTDAATLEKGIFAAARRLDMKNVPDEGRHLVLPPASYYLMLQGNYKFPINRDFNGTGGSYGAGTLPPIAGFIPHKSNVLIPSVLGTTADAGATYTYTSPSGVSNDYDLTDISDLVGLAFHEASVGTVQLMGLQFESEYKIENQATLMVAKYAVGHGTLRTEGAVYLSNETDNDDE